MTFQEVCQPASTAYAPVAPCNANWSLVTFRWHSVICLRLSTRVSFRDIYNFLKTSLQTSHPQTKSLQVYLRGLFSTKLPWLEMVFHSFCSGYYILWVSLSPFLFPLAFLMGWQMWADHCLATGSSCGKASLVLFWALEAAAVFMLVKVNITRYWSWELRPLLIFSKSVAFLFFH